MEILHEQAKYLDNVHDVMKNASMNLLSEKASGKQPKRRNMKCQKEMEPDQWDKDTQREGSGRRANPDI